jgi:hypothetical protein
VGAAAVVVGVEGKTAAVVVAAAVAGIATGIAGATRVGPDLQM